MAIAAGPAFDSRWPSSRCSNGPRSQFAQIAKDIPIRTAEPIARARAMSGIRPHLESLVIAARIDRGREGVGQVNRSSLS